MIAEMTYQYEGHKLMYFETKQQSLNFEGWVKDGKNLSDHHHG